MLPESHACPVKCISPMLVARISSTIPHACHAKRPQDTPRETLFVANPNGTEPRGYTRIHVGTRKQTRMLANARDEHGPPPKPAPKSKKPSLRIRRKKKTWWRSVFGMHSRDDNKHVTNCAVNCAPCTNYILKFTPRSHPQFILSSPINEVRNISVAVAIEPKKTPAPETVPTFPLNPQQAHHLSFNLFDFCSVKGKPQRVQEKAHDDSKPSARGHQSCAVEPRKNR